MSYTQVPLENFAEDFATTIGAFFILPNYNHGSNEDQS